MDVELKRPFAIPARAVWTLAFLLLTYVYYHLFRMWPHNSDDANSMLIGYDIFHGNPLLRGWYSPPDSFYATDAIYLGFLTLLLGASPRVMVLTPAIVWSATVLLCAWCAIRFSPNRRFALGLILVTLALPVTGIAFTMEMITKAPMHISTVVYAMVVILIANHWLEVGTWRIASAAVLIGLIAVTVASDPLILFIGALPVLMMCAHEFAYDGRKKDSVSLGIVIVASIVAGKMLMAWISAAGGFSAHPQPMTFASFDRIGQNIQLFLHGLLILFGANFTGRALSVGETPIITYLATGPIVMMARLPVLILVVWGIVLTGVRIAKRSQAVGRFEMMLFFSIVVITGAILVSDQMADISSSRYCFPILILGVVLASIALPANPAPQLVVKVATVVSAVAFCAAYLLSVQNPIFAEKQDSDLADFLKSNHMTQGYAPYWTSSIVMVLTDGDSRLRAVMSSGADSLEPFKWLSKHDWYQLPPKGQQRFVIVDSRARPFSYERQRVINVLGQPLNSYHVGPYEILMYSTDTSDFSRLSLP